VITEVPFLNAKVVTPYEYRQISDLRIGYMPRGLDGPYVQELYDILKDGGKFYDNIAIFEDGELIDGLHRLEAYKRTSLLTILVQVWKCPKENRTALKIHLNSAHGKQLSRREKQESYFNLIQENPEITDEQAAKVFAVTERTIQRWKPEALKQKRLSQEEVQKIHEMKEEGKTNTEIAKELEVEEGAIRHHIRKNDNCHIYDSDPNSPEPSNVIPSPVSFQKQESDDYDDEDEEDFDIEAPDEDKKVYTVVKKEPTLRDEWKITMEAILRISERADKLRSHLHEIVLPGEFELVLCGSLQKAQNFLSYLREFVPEDTTIPNERR